MNKIFPLFLVFVCIFWQSAEGLRCYTCSYDNKDPDSNELCVTAPWELPGNPIRTCRPNMKFCIIVRNDCKKTGKTLSFLRKCEENPVEDSDIDSMTVVTHYRSCTTDLCNKGDGLDYIGDGHEGDSVAILVPDRSSSSAAYPTHVFIFFSFFILQVWNQYS